MLRLHVTPDSNSNSTDGRSNSGGSQNLTESVNGGSTLCVNCLIEFIHILMWAAELADLGRDPDPGSERRVLYIILS